ncbi:hypothetical protein QQS21_006706 [Conoideocrella luteorostrata]|uniref:Agmatinase n=1 Tax=Conoideocrella luteorostrata TaxID=1105319 RepID=A0AAJ0CPV8_9HYPO|nr:hypothetical protein QQS21_006706 [Conoideocrella luteorostrata]
MKAAALVGLLFWSSLSSACAGHEDGKKWTKEELAELEANWGQEWSFSGIGSFAHLDHTKCLLDPAVQYDIAIVGAPFDTAVAYRPGKHSLFQAFIGCRYPLVFFMSTIITHIHTGARFGPRAIRHASGRQVAFRAFNPRANISPYQNWAKIIDCGDIPITPFDNNIAREQMTEASKLLGNRRGVSVLKPKPMLMTLGGDHRLTLPALRALNEIYGRPVRVLYFDIQPTWIPGTQRPTHPTGGITHFTHGSMFWMANQEGLLSNATHEKSVHVGLRTHLIGNDFNDNDDDTNQGWVRFSADDNDEIGTTGIIDGIMGTLETKDPVYLSMDIDVLDPACAPGTGTPKPGGWATRELIRILRGIEGLNFVGADFVEVSPTYQGNEEETALAAAQVVYEVLSLMVKRGMNGIVKEGRGKDELQELWLLVKCMQ